MNTSTPSTPLLARRSDVDRLFAARAVCYVVSGYDGAGNYGDVLQLAACLDTLQAASPEVVAAPLVNWAFADEFAVLERSAPSMWERAVPLFYRVQDIVLPVLPSMFTEVPAPPPVPDLLVVAGGGFLNQHWGPEKLQLVESLQSWQDLAPNPRSRCGRPLAFGQQVSAWALSDPAARRFLDEAACVGVRDKLSLERLHTIGGGDSGRFFFSGDEATLEVGRLAAVTAAPRANPPTITVHVSLAMNPRALPDVLATALSAVAEHFDGRIRLRFVAAHEDGRISETEEQRPVVEALRPRGIETDAVPLYPDAAAGVSAIAAGALTIACSYHVALTSLLLGIPTILVHGDPYYDEKHQALAEIFGIPDTSRVDSRSATAPEIAAAVIAALENPDVRRAATEGLAAGALALSTAQVEARRRLTTAVHAMIDETSNDDLSYARTELAETLSRLSDLRLMNNSVTSEASRILAANADRERAFASQHTEAEARLGVTDEQVAALGAQVEILTFRMTALEEARAATEVRLVEVLADAARDREAGRTALADKDRHIANLEALLARYQRPMVSRAAAAVSRTLRRASPKTEPPDGPVAPR